MPNTPDYQPTLQKVLKTAGNRAIELMRVAIPAVVVSYDSTKRTCSAQPLIQHPRPEGGHRSDPALADVPVLFWGTGRHRVKFPLRKGDTVLLVFLDRASDEWALSLLQSDATNPKEQAPAERRFHDVTDAVAIPISTGPDVTTLEFTEAGTVLVHGGTSGEAVALATKADIDALAAVVASHTHPHGDPLVGATATSVPSASGTSVLKAR